MDSRWERFRSVGETYARLLGINLGRGILRTMILTDGWTVLVERRRWKEIKNESRVNGMLNDRGKYDLRSVRETRVFTIRPWLFVDIEKR